MKNKGMVKLSMFNTQQFTVSCERSLLKLSLKSNYSKLVGPVA